MQKAPTTSLDYQIISATGVHDLRDLAKIRDKNRTFWQSKSPLKEIKIQIQFVPSILSHIEIGNNGTPKISIKCFERDELGERKNEFTCLSSTTIFNPDIPTFESTATGYKTMNLKENPNKPNLKYNAMEIILMNPYHDEKPSNMGLTYFILFVKKEQQNEKISPNFKIPHNFFDSSLLEKSEKKPSEKIFSGINNAFKRDRYSGLMGNQTNKPKEVFQPLSLTPNSKKPIERITLTSTDKKITEEEKYQEDLKKALEESKRSSNKKPSHVDLNLQDSSQAFEEQLQKALAESIATYQNKRGNEEQWEENYYDCDRPIGMELELDVEEIPNRAGKIFENYKKMIYENENHGIWRHHPIEEINENSMFPLVEDHLSPAYLTLENKKK